MPDPTDPLAVADDPSGIVQQMPEGGDEVLIRVADANSADPALDDLSVTLAIQLADAEAEIALLRAEVERLRQALTVAANRLLRCSVDYDTGSHSFIETGEWADEAHAALSPETDGGQDAPADS